MSDYDEQKFFELRKQAKTYISKVFAYSDRSPEPLRQIRMVLEGSDSLQLGEIEGAMCLRLTGEKRKTQVTALVTQDHKQVRRITLQTFKTRAGDWIQGYEKNEFTFRRGEFQSLLKFLEQIEFIDLSNENNFQIEDISTQDGPKAIVDASEFGLVHLPDADAIKVLEDNPQLVAEFARSKITTEDVVALAYRRQELDVFRNMLDQSDVSEDDWQKFFERNQWIFGYGLAYVFTTGLDDETLQGTIRGASQFKAGKQPDAIMKTRAAINALCLVEIKKHSTGLLKKGSYRSGTWAPTAELSGAVAQSQENVRVAVEELGVYHQFTDQDGNPTGEDILAVQPRSFLIIGDLSEFQSDNGPNVARYRSFEDYRRNLRQPEILTFDELFERARFIVENADHPSEDSIQNDVPDEFPF